MQDLEFLKEVLSVSTVSTKEEKMVEFIVNWLKENNIEYYVDEAKRAGVNRPQPHVTDLGGFLTKHPEIKFFKVLSKNKGTDEEILELFKDVDNIPHL